MNRSFSLRILEKIFFYTFPIWVFKIGGLKIFEIPLTILISVTLIFFLYKNKLNIKKSSLPYILIVFLILISFFYGIIVLQSFPSIEWAEGIKAFYLWNSLYAIQVVIIFTILYLLNTNGTSINTYDILIMFCTNVILLFLLDIRTNSALFMEKGLLGGYLAILTIFYFELTTNKFKYILLIITIFICINIGATRGLLFLMGYFIAIYGVKYFSIKNFIILISILSLLLYFVFENNIANVNTKLNLVSDILFDTQLSPYKNLVEKHSVGRYASLFMIERGLNYNELFGVGLGNYVFFREIYADSLPIGFHDYAGFLFADNIVELGVIGTLLWYFSFFKIISYGYPTIIKIQVIVFAIFLTLLAVKNDYYSFMMLAIYLGIQTNKYKKVLSEKNINY